MQTTKFNQTFLVSDTHIQNNFFKGTSYTNWENDTFHILEYYKNHKKSIYLDIGAWIGPTVLYSANIYNKVIYCSQNKTNMSDGDTKTETTKNKRNQTSICERCIVAFSHVLPSIWVRCTIQADNGLERFVLDSRRRLLLNFRLFLVIVYIAYTLFK
jgi:hypothetical protein